MLEPKFIRTNPDAVRQGMINQKSDTIHLDDFLSADESWRKALIEVDKLKALRNDVSEKISQMKRAKEDASAEIERMREVSEQIKVLDAEVKVFEDKMQSALLMIPNMPDSSVPVGFNDEGNIVVKTWGEPKEFDLDVYKRQE